MRSVDFDSSSPTSPLRRLGQNFLNDKAARELIVNSADLSRSDIVLEVGPGTGFLTDSLLDRAGKVIGVEMDARLVRFLRQKYRVSRRLRIIEGDVLNIKLPRFNKVVSCPPYYISSRLVLLLIFKRFRLVVLTLQKEFAERIAANPGSSEYGRISVMVQHKASVDLAGTISKHSFRPVPKVDSEIVVIRRKKAEVPVKNEKLFGDLVRFFFTQRRRKAARVLRRYLETVFGDEGRRLQLVQSLPDVRVFQLSVGDFERLSNEIAKLRGEGLG